MSGIFSSGRFQQVGGQASFRKYEQWDAGDQIAGKLVEVRKDKFGKPAYVIQVEEVSFKKASDAPQVGSLFTLNSAGGLQYKIEQCGGVALGDTIGVEYNGKVDITKGKWKGSKAHDIDFFISKGDSANREVVGNNEEAGSSEDLDLV